MATQTPEPPFREWHLMSGSDFAALDRDTTVVRVSCSPLEVHGPHLPVGADLLESDMLGRRTMALVKERRPEITFIHLPGIWVAADVLPHPGSLRFRSSTITRVLSDLGRSLCRQGLKNIWVGNFHGGPRHFVPIEIAADRTNRRYGGRMVSVFGLFIKLFIGDQDPSALLSEASGLPVEALVGDAHAGIIETSMLLHGLGDAVKRSFIELPRQTVDAWRNGKGKAPLVDERSANPIELVAGLLSKMKYYEEQTYAGDPARATAELGEIFLNAFAEKAAEALTEVWDGKLDPADCRSPLWPFRWLLTNETLNWALERVIRYRDPVF